MTARARYTVLESSRISRDRVNVVYHAARARRCQNGAKHLFKGEMLVRHVSQTSEVIMCSPPLK